MDDVFNTQKETIHVGVIADTHLPARLKRLPPPLLSALAGADVILHAGDVDLSESLAELRKIAPVFSVRGNYHFLDGSDGGKELPAILTFVFNGRKILLTHGHQPGWKGLLKKAPDLLRYKILHNDQRSPNAQIIKRLRAVYPAFDVLVFGHTHSPCMVWQGKQFFFNPGAVCAHRNETSSFGFLHISGREISAEIVFFEPGFEREE